MKFGGGVVLAAFIAAAACGRGEVPTQGTVGQLDVSIAARVDGALDVREGALVEPDADGVVVWRRVIESPSTDRLSFVSFAVDDVPVEPDGQGLTVEADDSNRLAVTWRAGRSTPARLELLYRADAAVAVSEPRGRVEWPVLGAGRTFDVGAVSLEFVVPEGTQIYDGTGIAEAGWTVESIPRGIRARRSNVNRADEATLLAVFDVDRNQVVPSDWEWDADRQGQYFLALVSAGLFILVVGIGILIQLRVQYPAAGPGAPIEAIEAARRDHRMLARGLRGTALAGLAFAAFSALLTAVWLSGLGLAAQAIPASIAVVSLMFAVAGGRYARKVRREDEGAGPRQQRSS